MPWQRRDVKGANPAFCGLCPGVRSAPQPATAGGARSAWSIPTAFTWSSDQVSSSLRGLPLLPALRDPRAFDILVRAWARARPAPGLFQVHPVSATEP